MEKQFVFWTVIVLQLKMLPAIDKQLMIWCHTYETFCLFHDKNRENVPDSSAARERCSGSKEKSWPLEIIDERVKRIVDEFINNSISNVILNAVLKDEQWYWKKRNTGNLLSVAIFLKATLLK